MSNSPVDEVYGDQWLTPQEFSKVIGKHPVHVNRLIRTGTLAEFGLSVYAGPPRCRGRRYFIFTPSSMLR